VSGDFADLTIYTDRYNRKTVYPFSPPDKPASATQAAMRARFKQVQAEWKALSRENKAALEAAARRLSLCLTGQNLWLSCSLRSKPETYAAIQRLSGVDLPPLFIAS
jgi:hypothetical protein